MFISLLLFLTLYMCGLCRCTPIDVNSNNTDQTLFSDTFQHFPEVNTIPFPTISNFSSSGSNNSDPTFSGSPIPDPYIQQYHRLTIEFHTYREPWTKFNLAQKAIILCLERLSLFVSSILSPYHCHTPASPIRSQRSKHNIFPPPKLKQEKKGRAQTLTKYLAEYRA